MGRNSLGKIAHIEFLSTPLRNVIYFRYFRLNFLASVDFMGRFGIIFKFLRILSCTQNQEHDLERGKGWV